ncbi:hypothetical protein GLOTRDRAFT_133764 [Gloeophyllum trabeum ATCC 11539]|uniref:MFS general substrate transporter n=1 Tax=Gloeophyllum trabeum (strain ATCC 11539 / FP-39264 / Madison 617) TaxID=670483 RepID=S7RDY3_GLOTA|nr:uncharacterized protein GLOTRDRAFT_133764 [Gloeophyllum trabeum ATCC 11539]EPQ50654.1 hypothetical protein GLOTRDRAFT_133764 [Gloeophyllum trabeum ATCC 11539]
MQLALFLAGVSAWLSVLLLLPETVQPDSQGLSRYLREKGKQLDSWVWVWLNPFQSLWPLKSPNVLEVTLAGTFVLMTDFVLMTPLAHTVLSQIFRTYVPAACDLLGSAGLVPVSILLSGLLTQFFDGTPGIVLNLICLFVNGIGIDNVLSPSNAYYVHRQSAEVIATSGAFRSIILAASTACVLPLINLIGVAATDALAAAIAWLGFV